MSPRSEYFHARRDLVSHRYQPYSFGANPNDQPLDPFIHEVKQALVDLARAGSDPLKGSDPVVETTWQHIDPSDPHWDPATADEFAAFVARHNFFDADPTKVMQLGRSGPQPTRDGMDMIWIRGDTPAYSQWRSQAPSDAQITPTIDVGANWGIGGHCEPPSAEEKAVDDQLVTAWRDLVSGYGGETRIRDFLTGIQAMRQTHDAITNSACGPHTGPNPYPGGPQKWCADHGLVWNPAAPPESNCWSQREDDCYVAGGHWDGPRDTGSCVMPVVPGQIGPAGVPRTGATGSIVPVVAIAGAATLLVTWAMRTAGGANPFGGR